MDRSYLEVAAHRLVDELGWAVFPCHVGKKRPAVPNGYKDSSVSHATIAAWWQARPWMNIGVDCGKSGLVVVDCDTGKGDDGLHGLERLEDIAVEQGRHSDLDARTHTTPSGGVHLVWSALDDLPISNSAGQIAPGVDVRALGGYILAPPSAVNRAYYRTIDSRRPEPLPRWLAELCNTRTTPARSSDPDADIIAGLNAPPVTDTSAYNAKVLTAVCDGVRTAENGRRNKTLHGAALRAGSLIRDRGLDWATAEGHLQAAGIAAGLPAAEVRATVRSGLRYATRGGP